MSSLPEGLPRPVDDGACDHLPGERLPGLALPATGGTAIDLAALPGRLVVFCFPRAGEAQAATPAGWDQIPGARGLLVLGVPSNDFGGQEPGTAAEIKQFCEVNFAVDFPLTEKQVVKGAAAHPFFREAVAELGADAAPRWNFHKFLVTPDGRLAGTWPSRVEPDAPEVTAAIEAVLPR
jgi:hypothetical protein